MGLKPSVNDNVAGIMDLYPPARNDNNLLVALYWQAVDGIKMPGDLANQIAGATSVESIVRARREVLQQDSERSGAQAVLNEIIQSLHEEGVDECGDKT